MSEMQVQSLLKDAQGFLASVDELTPRPALQQKHPETELEQARATAHVSACATVARLLASAGQSLEQRHSAELERRWAAESAVRDLRAAAERLEAKAREEQASVEAARAQLKGREADRRDRTARLEKKLRHLESRTGVRFDAGGPASDAKWRGCLLGRASDGCADVPFCLDAGEAAGDSRRRAAAREALWGLMRPRGGAGWACSLSGDAGDA